MVWAIGYLAVVKNVLVRNRNKKDKYEMKRKGKKSRKK